MVVISFKKIFSLIIVSFFICFSNNYAAYRTFKSDLTEQKKVLSTPTGTAEQQLEKVKQLITWLEKLFKTDSHFITFNSNESGWSWNSRIFDNILTIIKKVYRVYRNDSNFRIIYNELVDEIVKLVIQFKQEDKKGYSTAKEFLQNVCSTLKIREEIAGKMSFLDLPQDLRDLLNSYLGLKKQIEGLNSPLIVNAAVLNQVKGLLVQQMNSHVISAKERLKKLKEQKKLGDDLFKRYVEILEQ